MTFKFNKSFMLFALAIGFGLTAGAVNNLNAAKNAVKSTISPAANMAQEPKTPSASVTITGKLTAASGSELTVTGDDKKEMRVIVTDKTRVMKGGAESKVSDLKQNDQVMIEASKGSDGQLVANLINVS
ncbi:MAG: DUF5666 domain-containing protein [Pyrinomonadaceae bacterium]